MKPEKSEISVLTTSSILSLLLATTGSATAQIIPDKTLPNNTIVAPNGQTINIEGGTRAGGNLFHSFQEFNLSAGSTAFFNNAVDIQNILSRVTGGNISNIDGLIRANGRANLFFINPAGIVFGSNARLNIGGSFLASSANRILFDDGSFFSASDSNAPPLLTINAPIGLQLGLNPGAIQVRGPGHNLSRENELQPFDRSEQLRAPTGLQVRPGNTLALVGGDVVLEGGILTALEGRIELGSVKQGNVSIDRIFVSVGGGNFNYEGVVQFGDILMEERSLVDASSLLGGGGSIHIQGQNFQLQGLSIILVQNLGSQPSGDIAIDAVESVILSGASNTALRTAIATSAIASGDNGDININTSRLRLSDGAAIANTTYAREIDPAGAGGDVDIRATDAVEVLGVSSVNSGALSAIITATLGSANAGRLTVSTARLRIAGGASITSSSFGSGSGAELNINATDFIEVAGVEPSNLLPSNANVFANREGNAGNLTINTSRLIVKDGGRVGASTLSSGNAGRVTINASESVFVSGRVSGSVNPSLIDSSANIVDEILQQLFGLPPVPTGDTGELTINTPSLRVSDGALVGVQHEGTGNAGNLRIEAGSVLVEGGAGITAGSASGFGGNISLDVGDSLLLRNGGRITARAGSIGDGGNLTINANTIVLLGNSNINADALQGAGGNIRMTTEGLFASTDSAITASSQLGVQGTIEIEGIDGDPSVGLANLPANVLDATTLIASGCAEFSGSEYIVTGRGGLPTAIDGGAIATILTWRDWRRADTTNLGLSSVSAVNIPEPTGNAQFVEATGWISRSDGVIELVADTGEVRDSWYQLPGCRSLK